jgi:ATP-dependent RNA helicase DeaD
MTPNGQNSIQFNELNLKTPILAALDTLGYKTPTPIQAEAIPAVLRGEDVLGQAQTGTGKTAAFALPILNNIDPKKQHPQVLILAPTRELVAQICDAFHEFAAKMPEIRITAIYGGQSYREQFRDLKRGVHIVVGAPGRVMDHIEKKTLNLSALSCIVLDEADEMLRMGFVDNVKWICEHAPDNCQKLLFSATMPREIKRIADQHLKNPVQIKIAGKATVSKIEQRYWMISGAHKLDALSRILETEDTDGVIVFVKTKAATLDVAENLSGRGFSCQALNGDMSQDQRQSAVDQLKSSKLNILIATDVAARGLDVERISHVINYDMPFNSEVYVHRIGRTGRAGRSGNAILFVSPRERRLLQNIERSTKQQIQKLELPTTAQIVKHRIAKFKTKITASLEDKNISFFDKIVQEYQSENDIEPSKLAAALAKMAQGNTPLILEPSAHKPQRRDSRDRNSRNDRDSRYSRESRGDSRPRRNSQGEGSNQNFASFRVEVGRKHGVRPGNIMGAIANEANLDRDNIGNISIFQDFSTVDLPNNLTKDVMHIIGKARVVGQPLKISEFKNGSNNFSKKEKPRFSKGPKENFKRNTQPQQDS